MVEPVVYREDGELTPWDMPHDIFWDKSAGATMRRAQWVVDNRPDVSRDEIETNLGIRKEEADQVGFGGTDHKLDTTNNIQ